MAWEWLDGRKRRWNQREKRWMGNASVNHIALGRIG